jgi:hypothetical protein
MSQSTPLSRTEQHLHYSKDNKLQQRRPINNPNSYKFIKLLFITTVTLNNENLRQCKLVANYVDSSDRTNSLVFTYAFVYVFAGRYECSDFSLMGIQLSLRASSLSFAILSLYTI